MPLGGYGWRDGEFLDEWNYIRDSGLVDENCSKMFLWPFLPRVVSLSILNTGTFGKSLFNSSQTRSVPSAP